MERNKFWTTIGVGLAAASACGGIYYLQDRFGSEKPVITVSGEGATEGDGSTSGSFSQQATSEYVPIITQLSKPTVACATIDGAINNPGRAVKKIKTDPRNAGVIIPEVPVVTVIDRSTLDNDPADGSVKHGPKPLSDYRNKDYVHYGDEVCIELQEPQSSATAIAPSSPVPATLEPTHNLYAPPAPGEKVDCTNLGLPLDNTISAACAAVGQNEDLRQTLECNGANSQNGFLQVDVYDFDPNSLTNSPAVSVHAQVGQNNIALPRENFASSCVDWRRDLPAWVNDNTDLFYPPIPMPAPTETPQSPTSMLYEDRRQESLADHASLVAAVTHKEGTIFADVRANARRLTFQAGNIPRRGSYRGRL